MRARADAVGGRDPGAVLVLVLIVTIVLSLVVVGLANYSGTLIRYGQVAETRADRLSAADGALRDAIERLRLSRSLCNTALGDSSVGHSTTFPEPINGATAIVTCRRVGSKAEAVQAWAIVVTGVGVTGANRAFTASQGTAVLKKIGGPVFVSDPASMDLSVPVQIVEGDLFYTSTTCAAEGMSSASGLTVPNLSFSPSTTRGTICTKKTWSDIFGPGPAVPDLSESASFLLRSAASYTTIGSCRVFSPGIYEAMPSLVTGGNYFRSGKYLLRNVEFSVNAVNQIVTAGAAHTAAGLAHAIPNPACDAARDADAAEGHFGATFYLEGSSRIDIHKGAFEILGAQRGSAWVAVQALSTSTLTATTDAVLSTATGENKEFTAQGLVWAPRARVDLGNITNNSAVQLHGGAVVAKFHIGANASINGYVIGVPTSPITQVLMITSTATKSGTTSIRAMVEYRPPREVAITSWRIVN
jgi:Tfp pilus assembly protein PilX